MWLLLWCLRRAFLGIRALDFLVEQADELLLLQDNVLDYLAVKLVGAVDYRHHVLDKLTMLLDHITFYCCLLGLLNGCLRWPIRG